MKLSAICAASAMTTAHAARQARYLSGKSSTGPRKWNHHPGSPPNWSGWGSPPEWGPSFHVMQEHEGSNKSGKGSGSSGKSSKGSKSSKGAKGGDGGSVFKYVWVPWPKEYKWSGDAHVLAPFWGSDDDGKWGDHQGYESSGKSSKASSSKSGKGSSKSSKGSSGKSSKGSSEFAPYWVGYDWGHPWGPGDPVLVHEGSGKSGKESGKSGKSSGKSGKGSKSSKAGDNENFIIYYEHGNPVEEEYYDDENHGWGGGIQEEYSNAPDSHSPGICAPNYRNGGLDCADEYFEYCTEPGRKSECGNGYSCYDKELCSDDHMPMGVCDASGEGLDCSAVTTYCTDPYGNGECGANRKCFPAGLCGLGDHGDDYYDGFCGALHGGELDCDEVTTKCTSVGSKSECANGAECFSSHKCYGDQDGDDYIGDDAGNTYLPPANLDDDGQGDHDDHSDYYPNDICFYKGNTSPCTDGPTGEPINVEFSYTAETSGVDAETIVSPLEYEILSSVSDYIAATAESYGVTRISSSPDDYIKDDEICTPKHYGDACSIIKGEMTVYADSHEMGPCDYSNIIQASMHGSDFSQVHGVKDVKYLNSGSSCGDASKIVAGESAVQDDDSLSAGAMIAFAMLAAFVAAAALLLARKLRRKPDANHRDMDLISVDTDFEGNKFGLEEDPFASTVDVHRCTSMYCNCNKGGKGTTFIPAPKKTNMDKVIKKHGLNTSPTGVDEAQRFFVGDPEPLTTVSMDTDDTPPSENSSGRHGNIIRVAPNAERSLTPVHEIAHDSEIDTEFESDGEEDLDSIPPPPPLPSGRQPKNNSLENDEMSI